MIRTCDFPILSFHQRFLNSALHPVYNSLQIQSRILRKNKVLNSIVPAIHTLSTGTTTTSSCFKI